MLIGIDEAGRGPWAGPLVIGAISLGENHKIDNLSDSKLLKSSQREALHILIKQQAIFYKLAWVDPGIIDRDGLTVAMQNAIVTLLKDVPILSTRIVMDGNFNYVPPEYDSEALIKADQFIPEVSAASIVAKVARDRYMAQMSIKYPGYGFESHVGYGTKLHSTRLKQLGPSSIHRRSFRPVRELN